MVRHPQSSTATAMLNVRHGRGRHAAHRSAQRTRKGHVTVACVTECFPCPFSELNRSPARRARDSGAAPPAPAPVRGCPALPASVEPVSRPHRPHPVPGRNKRRASAPESVESVRKTKELGI